MDRLTDTCNADMGGIWLPDHKGISSYVPLRCTRHAGHLRKHAFIDDRSGHAIMIMRTPTIEVDQRGCIKEKV